MKLKRILFFFLILFPFCIKAQDDTFTIIEKKTAKLTWTDTDSAKIMLEKLEELAASANEPELYARSINTRGVYYYSIADYGKALNHYTKAYQWAKKWNNTLYMGKVLNNIGACHIELNNLTKAAEYFTLALFSFRKAKDDFWELNATYNLANVNLKSKKWKTADSLYLLLEKKYLQSGKIAEAGYSNMSRGRIKHENKKYEEALALYQLAMSRIDTLNNKYIYAILLQNIAFSRYETKQYSKAIESVSASTQLTFIHKHPKMRLNNYELTANCYKKLNLKDSALLYLEKLIALKDTVFNDTKQAEFAKSETRFNTLLKENQIKLQEKLIKQKNNSIFWLISVLALVLGLITMLFWVYRSLRIAKSHLEISLVEKDALLREIHHRVKNNLQIVSSLLNMHVRKVKDPSSKKILEEGSERLLAMSLIHKNLYPHADLKSVSLDEYLANLSLQLFENYQLDQAHISLETQLEKVSVDIDKLIPIGLVVNELLSNAMKHAFEENATGKIYIRLFQEVPNYLILEVADNGKGISDDWQANIGNSLGMKLVKIFCDKLKTELLILNDAGTKVQLNIPIS